jgi:cobalt-zinc-cadmium efflux system outer membrane protein
MLRFALITALLLAQMPAAPQGVELSAASPPAASLAQATELAWQRTPAASALPQRMTEATASSRAADAWTPGPPTLGMSTLSDRLNSHAGRQEWELEIATPLWLPGQRAAQRSRTQLLRALLSAQAAANRLMLAGQVRDAWWQLAAAQAGVQAAARRVDTAQALQADVERRWRAGELARIDANAAQAESHTAGMEWLAAERERDNMRAAWQQLTGVAAPAVFADEVVAGPPAGIDAHPSLVAAAAAEDAAQSQLRLLDHSGREAPELALRWVRDRDTGGQPYANRIGVQLRIPLASPPKSLAELAGARAELVEAQTARERVRDQIALDVERAQRELESATQMLTLARQRALLSTDTLQLLQKSFSFGETDLPALLRARVDAFGADAELARQQLARSAAISRLNQALGAMP